MIRSKHTYDAAEDHLRCQPDQLLHKMIAHFQRLFEVKALDGVFPKMNELYLTVNEARNCMSAIKSMLRLGKCIRGSTYARWVGE